MKRKLIVIFAALTLSACMLTGCGGDKKDDSKTEPTTVSATQATTAAATEAKSQPTTAQQATAAENKASGNSSA
jgi:outer membrane murein-binding lipoprotein Lpp